MERLEETDEENEGKTPELPLSKKRWGVLICFSMTALSSNSGVFAFTSISNLVQEYYSVSMTAVNWLSIVYALMFLPLSIPYSYLTNRLGLRFILILVAVLDFLGTIVRYAGKDRHGYLLLLIGCVLSASSLAGVMLQPAKIASVWFGERERALATGIGVATDALGMASGFLQSSVFIGQVGPGHVEPKHFSRMLLTQSVIGLLSFLSALILAKDKPESPPTWSQAFAYDLSQDKITELSALLDKKDTKEYGEHDAAEVTNNKDQGKEVLSLDDSYMNARKSFWRDLISLLRNQQFMLIVHLHAIAFTLDSILLTFVNELLIPKFPGREFYIGMMGAFAVAGSAIGNLGIGVIIDRIKRYKICTFIIFSFTTILCVVFGLLYYCGGGLFEIAVIFLLFELVMTCYFTVAFEQSAEATFPISESAFSVLLILSGQLYIFILTAIGTSLLSYYGPISTFIMIYTLVFLGVVGSFFLKDVKIRSYFDKREIQGPVP